MCAHKKHKEHTHITQAACKHIGTQYTHALPQIYSLTDSQTGMRVHRNARHTHPPAHPHEKTQTDVRVHRNARHTLPPAHPNKKTDRWTDRRASTQESRTHTPSHPITHLHIPTQSR